MFFFHGSHPHISTTLYNSTTRISTSLPFPYLPLPLIITYWDIISCTTAFNNLFPYLLTSDTFKFHYYSHLNKKNYVHQTRPSIPFPFPAFTNKQTKSTQQSVSCFISEFNITIMSPTTSQHPVHCSESLLYVTFVGDRYKRSLNVPEWIEAWEVSRKLQYCVR